MSGLLDCPKEIIRGHGEAAIALLTALLPSMKTIDLCKHACVHEYHINEVLRLIADWNPKQSKREHPDSIQPAGTQPDIIQPERKQILSNLTVLNVSGYQEAKNTTYMLIP